MRDKLLSSARLLLLLFAVAGIMAAAAAGPASKGMPDLRSDALGVLAVFGSPAPASASTFTIEAASAAPVAPLAPVGTGFTYRGRLLSAGSAADGSYDFRFTLFDELTAGGQVGGAMTVLSQTVSGGLFAVILDFGPDAFQGDARYLQIEVRPAGNPTYSLLDPRQPITPVPYALFAFKAPPYKNVVTVAQSGGQFTSITDALNSIPDADDTNRYLVRVGPGTYTDRVFMKEYVDIEGAGENATRITHPGSPNPDTGTVVGANNAELRSLTVENTGNDSEAVAIFNDEASPSLLHVTVIASGGSVTNYGLYNRNFSSPKVTDVTVTAWDGPNLVQSIIGVFNLNGSSPNMTDVTVSASGAVISNFGVTNNSSSPVMNNVTVTASGGAYNHNVGVNSFNSSSPEMNNVNVSASDAAGENVGVKSDSSSTRIVTSVITAGGISSYGVQSVSTTVSGTVTIDNSKIAGDGYSINNGSGAITRVGASQLSGPVSNAGTLTCAGVHDENYVFYSNTCP
jgi:hypothetical protein